MYISRIALNPERLEAKKLLASPACMHSAVEHAFPPSSPRNDSDGRILWRVDMLKESHQVWLYVVSPDKPDFSHVVEQAGWPLHPEWETRDYRPLLDRIAVGQHWAFRLRANPVRKVRKDKGRRENPAVVGKIMGEVTADQQLKWLSDRAERYGFSIDGAGDNLQCQVKNRRKERFRHGDGTVTLSTAQFDGTLTVTDADLFRTTLTHGIGRAKGFGCGLLTVAPIHAGSALGASSAPAASKRMADR